MQNNRREFAKAILLSYDSIRKIEDPDDADTINKYKQLIKEARYYYVAWVSKEMAIDPPWIKCMVDQEMRPIQAEFELKMALLKEAQKK